MLETQCISNGAKIENFSLLYTVATGRWTQLWWGWPGSPPEYQGPLNPQQVFSFSLGGWRGWLACWPQRPSPEYCPPPTGLVDWDSTGQAVTACRPYRHLASTGRSSLEACWSMWSEDTPLRTEPSRNEAASCGRLCFWMMCCLFPSLPPSKAVICGE